MCSYIYCGTRQYCQIHLCNDCICMFCETWIEFAWFYNSEILVKMPLHFQRHFRVTDAIAYFFLWTWNCFSNFSWCVKRSITFAWNCFQKRYSEPSWICWCLRLEWTPPNRLPYAAVCLIKFKIETARIIKGLEKDSPLSFNKMFTGLVSSVWIER